MIPLESACYFVLSERICHLPGGHPGKTGNGGFWHEGIRRDGAAREIHAGGFRRLVKEPYKSGIHPQVEAAAEKEGEAGLPRRTETAGLSSFPGHKLHKNRPGTLCGLWRESTCYYRHSERICVLPKGCGLPVATFAARPQKHRPSRKARQQKKQNGGNAHEGIRIYGETRDRRVKGEDF